MKWVVLRCPAKRLPSLVCAWLLMGPVGCSGTDAVAVGGAPASETGAAADPGHGSGPDAASGTAGLHGDGDLAPDGAPAASPADAAVAPQGDGDPDGGVSTSPDAFAGSGSGGGATAADAGTGADPAWDGGTADIDAGQPPAPLADASVPPGSAQAVGATQKVCVFAGEGGHAFPGQEGLGFYGTDLGYNYAHAGRLEVIFGDTWATELGLGIDSANPALDDAYGSVDLSAVPDGDTAEALCPTQGILEIGVRQLGVGPVVAALDPGQDADTGEAISGRGLQTPVSAFSSGTQEFALFSTGKAILCEGDPDCPAGFACDPEVGYFEDTPDPARLDTGFPELCHQSEAGCIGVSGMCVDTGSSGREPLDAQGEPADPRGHVYSVVYHLRVGVRSTEAPRNRYTSQAWLTNRFTDIATATVERFAPEQPLADHVYTTATGQSPADDRVLIWGRPWWMTSNARGRTLRMYLAYVDMPVADDAGKFSWQPRYFTGVDDAGKPRFGADQTRAAALDLSAPTDDPTDEVADVVNQMTIRYIQELGKWVMFYSGSVPSRGPACTHEGIQCGQLDQGNGAVKLRTAAHPWGPWSAPVEVIAAGLIEASPLPPFPESLYGDGGILYHPDCTGSCAPRSDSSLFCATHENTLCTLGPLPLAESEVGAIYAPAIIEPWTEVRPGGVEVYWIASTWDPYGVYMLKTLLPF